MMIISILEHTPARIWGLLALLVALGLSQTRSREMSLLRITVLPAVLLALSLTGVVSAFGHVPVALAAWVAGVTAALGLGRRAVAVRGAAWSAERGLLQVPGSWLPLVLIVGLFLIKYMAGVSLVLNPALATDLLFAPLCSLAYGAFSGLFLARALSLRSLASKPPTLSLA
jgi:hypothetical protein